MTDKKQQVKDKFENYNFPKDRKYLINNTPNHLWLKEDLENNLLVLGLSDFFQKRIGELKAFSTTAKPGITTTSGKTLAIVKAKNYSSVLKHQLDGKVIEINDLNKNPRLVNNSPYEKGWILKFELESVSKDQLNKKWVELVNEGENLFKEFIELEIKNNALLPDDCCPDFLGGSGVVRRRKKN